MDGSLISVLICCLIVTGIAKGTLTDEKLQEMVYGEQIGEIDHDKIDMIRTSI